MHKPNKIPGMKLKGIDRKRDRDSLYSKRDRERFAEQAKINKQEREDKKRLKHESNNRTSSNNRFAA